MSANAFATGGGGSDFERRVATAFLCHAITGTACPPLNEPVSAIWLQAGHLGCRLEDLVLEVEDAEKNRPRRRAFLSVKSSLTFNPSDEEFREVIQRGWEDFHDPEIFAEGSDLLGLIVAIDRSRPIYPVVQLTELARASRDAAEFDRRAGREGSLANSVRQLLGSIVAVLDQCQPKVSSESRFRFLRHFYVAAFDFDQDSSYDRARTIGLVRLASRNRDLTVAEACWNDVFENVSQATGKARHFGGNEFREFAEKHVLNGDLDQRGMTWLAAIRDHCRVTREGISSKLQSNNLHFARTSERSLLRQELNVHRVILISGAAGSGKSALAVNVAEEFAGSEQVFCFNAGEFNHPHLDVALQLAGLKDILLREWSSLLPLCPRVLVIDGVEHLLESDGPRESFNQLLREVNADPRWSLILTCRDYLSDEARILEDSNLPWKVVEVPLLEPGEVQLAVNKSNFPASLLSQPVVAKALRNLKWLDLTLTATQNLNSAPIDFSAWTGLAEWRRYVWKGLLYQSMDVAKSRRCEELLISFSVGRTLNEQFWTQVDSTSLDSAETLVALGLLRRLPPHSDRFRIDHDLVEDWALLRWIERRFADHCLRPEDFFGAIGNSLIMRRTFRQYLGELLEIPQQDQGIDFLKRIMGDAQLPKFWREEAVVAFLGSTEAGNVINKTRDIWIGQNAEEFLFLVHCLRIAYLGAPISKGEIHRPTGPGWAAILEFIDDRQPEFIQSHLPVIFDLLLEWKDAIQLDSPQPSGFQAATSLARKIWAIAITSETRFERLLGEERMHFRARQNRLACLMTAVAEGLGEDFFLETDVKSRDRSDDFQSPVRQGISQARDLIDYLAIEANGWTVARAFPQLMIKICERHYGLEPPPTPSPFCSYSGVGETCGLSVHKMDFFPSSALRGPFLTLLRCHPSLGKDFILRLTNAAITRYASNPPDNPYIASPIQMSLTVGDTEVVQWADPGWWRCYRGASPYPELIESCLMALEKWLLEEVSIHEPEKLEETLLELVAGSQSIAVTGVAASVANVHPTICGKIAAALLSEPKIFYLDDDRCVKQSVSGRWGRLGDQSDIYEQERVLANASAHYRESVEHTVFKAQFGPARAEIWRILDEYKVELQSLEQDESVQSFRLRIHRMDLRNAVQRKREDEPDRIYLENKSPAEDLQKFLNATAEDYRKRTSPMNLQVWAHQILDPLPGQVAQPERWREMLISAQELSVPADDKEQQFMFGGVSAVVAAACVLSFWSEMNDDQKTWCENAVTRGILQDAPLSQWESGGLWAGSPEKVYLAQALGHLVGLAASSKASAHTRRRGLAIALTHPEHRVVEAAAKGLGGFSEPEITSLQFAGVELLVRHARLRRMTDFKYRGPSVGDDLTWDQRRHAMHMEIYEQTERLRDDFANKAPADLNRLTLFYPRGFEEYGVLAATLMILVRQKSVTARRFFSRALKWLVLQWYWDGASFQRLFGRDQWRDHHVSRPNPVTIGEVCRRVAEYILNQSPEDAAEFLLRYLFRNLWAAKLGREAGELLRDLCISLDATGGTETFWSVWREYRDFTRFIGSQIHEEDFWEKNGISRDRGLNSFGHLVSALFLNGMYWRQDQEWKQLEGEEYLFADAFTRFGAYSFGKYIEFLGTIGGKLLPDAWIPLSECLSKIQELSLARGFLSGKRRQSLLRLIQNEVTLLRIPTEEKPTWKAVRHLLDYLVDEGLPEAYRLRDGLPRSIW